MGDRDDDRALVHARNVLNLSRNTASYVELWAYGNTSLTNLTLMLAESSIDSGAACAHFSAKHIGELEDEVEILFATYAVATSYDAKVQSEVTITLEAEGDPSTFEMTLTVLRSNVSGEDEMMKLVRYAFADSTTSGNGDDIGSLTAGTQG